MHANPMEIVMRRCLLFLALAFGLICLGCEDAPSSLTYTAPPAIGSTAPSFTQMDTAGNPVSLEQFRGKVVLLDFWATWCAPCVRELPNMKALWQQYRNKNFQIVSVSLDFNLTDWRTFIRQYDLNWVHVADGNYWHNTVARRYGITGIPQMYLIDETGKIISEGIVIDEDRIENALK